MKRKIWAYVRLLFLLLQVVAEGLLAWIILKLDVLPDHFLLPILGLLVLSAVCSALFMFAHGKKKVSVLRMVIACILAAVIAAACGVGIVALGELYETMHSITVPETDTQYRNVYVLQEDAAQTIEDTANYVFGVMDGYDQEYIQLAVAHIEARLGTKLQLTGFDTIDALVGALYDGSVQAVIINGGYALLLEQQGNYTDFSQKTRLLYEAELTIELPPVETEPTIETTEAVTTEEPTQPLAERTIVNSPFVVYLSGVDTYYNLRNVALSDVNILAVVNPVTKQVLLVSTPRDYYVPNPEGNGEMDKLTHCGTYGIDCSIAALEALYEIDVDYYAKINFTGFKTLIDAIGGIVVYSEATFKVEGEGERYIYKGENYVDGQLALGFARERYHMAGGDNARGRNQMQVIRKVIEKLTSGTTIISNYAAILDSMQGMFITSVQMEEISMLVKMQLSDMASWDVLSYSTIGTGGNDYTYSMPGYYLYVMYENEESTAHASELIQRMMAGETLTQEDLQLNP